MPLQPSGSETLVEQWIFHKLNIAATQLNIHLTERNFMSATIDVHNFWLYELCDVYIVSQNGIPLGLINVFCRKR